MSSVTKRVKEIKQPRGGLVRPRDFEVIKFEDNKVLLEENLYGGTVATVVDYMTRFIIEGSVEKAFEISIKGAKVVNQQGKATRLIDQIKGIDDTSIKAACKLVGYDVCYRQGGYHFKGVDALVPDENTINNIKVMIERSQAFIDKYGPIVKYGFTFKGGYTDIVTTGDGDFLTKDTLWDFKVSKQSPTTAHTLQLLMYYLMGKRSVYREFDNITKIGIFNPRLNAVYIMDTDKIPDNVIGTVEKDIIGYSDAEKNNPVNSENTETGQNVISLPEFLKETGYSRSTVMRWYKNDAFPMYKIKNRYYIDLYELQDWMEKKARQAKITKIVMTIFLILLIVFGVFIYNLIMKSFF